MSKPPENERFCVLKINGWKLVQMYFLLFNSPFLGDMLVFRGVPTFSGSYGYLVGGFPPLGERIKPFKP